MWVFVGVRLFATPWTITSQAPLPVEFSRQESWYGLPFLSPVDLSDSGIKPRSPALQANSLPSEPPGCKQEEMQSLWGSGQVTLSLCLLYLYKNIHILTNPSLLVTHGKVTLWYKTYSQSTLLGRL